MEKWNTVSLGALMEGAFNYFFSKMA